MILDWGIPSKKLSRFFGQPCFTKTPVRKIKFLAVLSSKTGLERIHSEFPELKVCKPVADLQSSLKLFMQIWVAGVDDKLTDQGLIWPGLGDAVRTASLCLMLPSCNVAITYREIVCSTPHRRFDAVNKHTACVICTLECIFHLR
jgi:hypothetical protein